MRAPVLAVAAAVIAALLTLTGCAATGVTSSRLEAAIGPTFAKLYRLEQQRLGTGSQRRADSAATCSRNHNGRKRRGAGDDWLCVLNYPYSDGHIEPVSYDVAVQPSGCYTAAGPSQVVGRQRQRSAGGDEFTNPLFQFDGCFDVTS